MKIGILTFHAADNCGAVLQAYALTKAIVFLDKGFEVEIIDYNMPYISYQYKYFALEFTGIKQFIKSIIRCTASFSDKIQSKKKFKEFRKNQLILSKNKYHTVSQIMGYDICIVGSDQVWNLKITGGDDVFFLKSIDSKSKKVAYAASIANNTIGNSEIDTIVENVKEFNEISIREKSTAKRLQHLLSQDVHNVLDPVFLIESSRWCDLIVMNNNMIKYILVYMVQFDEEALKAAERISVIMDLPVWCITSSIRKGRYRFKFIKNVGPIEFLGLIKNSEFVITSSFHGTAFSIIFKKNFITIPHKETSSRMIDLLELFDLRDRIISFQEEINDSFDLNIDYRIPCELLKEEINKSFIFLLKSLGDLQET